MSRQNLANHPETLHALSQMAEQLPRVSEESARRYLLLRMLFRIDEMAIHAVDDAVEPEPTQLEPLRDLARETLVRMGLIESLVLTLTLRLRNHEDGTAMALTQALREHLRELLESLDTRVDERVASEIEHRLGVK